MFALECASHLTTQVNLLYEPIGPVDLQALGEILQRSRSAERCPSAPTAAIPEAITDLFGRIDGLRPDGLVALWVEAKDEAVRCADEDQRLWAAQTIRRLLSRDATQGMFGMDRAEVAQLIGSVAVVDEVRRQKSIGLADNHLHSGAADELGDLLARIVPKVVERAEPRNLHSAVGLDHRGQQLNIAPLVVGLAAACLLLDGSDELDSRREQFVASSSWWRAAVRAAREARGINASDLAALREPVRRLSEEIGRPPQMAVLHDTLQRAIRGNPVTARRLEAARRGLVALSAIHGLVMVPRTSDLGSFVTRFDLMRKLRGLFGPDTHRVPSALYSMYVHSGVTAVELRKSIVAESQRTVSVPRIVSGIAADVAEHAAGAIAACEDLEIDHLVVRMPLTFTRLEAPPVDRHAEGHGFVPYRSPVAETMAVADAIVQATREERVARFVGGIDVVGNEKKVPNWLYGLAYKRIAPHSDLEFACHAGEYFTDRVEGLRRIAELALFQPAVVRRIGHCLALATEHGLDGEGLPDAGTLLENVVWTLSVIDGSADVRLGLEAPLDIEPPLVRELRRVLVALAPCVFGARVSVQDVRRWYFARFELAEAGRWIRDLDRVSPLDALQWPRGVDRALLPQPIDVADAMLASTIFDMPSTVSTATGQVVITFNPAAAVPGGLREEARAALEALSARLVEPVGRWFIASEAVVEVCPSSNAALGPINIFEHPVWDFHSRELPCSVNTDDPALFGASLPEEYLHAGAVAVRKGFDGARFVETLARTSRAEGSIQRPLSQSRESPLDVYRALRRAA